MQLCFKVEVTAPAVENLLRQILTHILLSQGKIMTALTDLQAQVTANTSVTQSAITLLNGLKSQLDAAIAAQAAGDDGAALAALSAQLGTDDAALASAVTANTPAAPADGTAPA